MQFHPPEIISEDTYLRIAASVKEGPSKHGYPTIIIHPDETVTKFFARKVGILSSARWKPYSTRFIDNALKLASHGINVPEIITHQRIENSHVHLVRYRSLKGTSIRGMLKSNPSEVDIALLAQYIHKLHEKGILFRAIHLGNIIQMPDQDFGLIDFTDVRYFNKPVPFPRRAANIAFILKYRTDVKMIKRSGQSGLAESYLEVMRNHNQPVDHNAFFRTIEERNGERR